MGASLPNHKPQAIKKADVERYRAVLMGKLPLDIMLIGNHGAGKTSLLTSALQSVLPQKIG